MDIQKFNLKAHSGLIVLAVVLVSLVGVLVFYHLLVLLGVGKGDTTAGAEYLAAKILGLRIFPDAAGNGKMDRSVLDVGGGVLVVSQFTLYAATRKGRRPSFDAAASPETEFAAQEAFAACGQISSPGRPAGRVRGPSMF